MVGMYHCVIRQGYSSIRSLVVVSAMSFFEDECI